MRLLYDLDGTLFHFDERFQELREELYPELTGIPHYTKQLTFNLWKDRTPEEQDAIRVIMNHPGFYQGLKPMEGAVEAVKEADALGYEVAFLSAPWTSNPTCVQDKYNDIGTVFGEEWMDRLILAKHKHMVSGTILFDDKEPIPLKETADWIQVYYDQPYNQGAEGFRIYNWSEWRGVVDQITDELRSESSADRAWRHYENLEAFA